MLGYPINVFVDSNIFIGSKYDVTEQGNLDLLRKYVKVGKIKLYISNIVRREVQRHIYDNSEKYRDDIISSYKTLQSSVGNFFSKNVMKEAGISKYYEPIPSAEEIAEPLIKKFNDFLIECKAEELGNAGIDVDKIINDYFGYVLPFQKRKEKRKEFPDAFMVQTIIHEFKGRELYIVCNDGGFKRVLKEIQGIKTLDSVHQLYDLLSQDSEIYNLLKQALSEDKNQIRLREAIEEHLNDVELFVEGMDCDRKGYTQGFEYDEVELTECHVGNIEEITIAEVSGDAIKITAKCNVSISVSCGFDDYNSAMYDSEDKEWLFINRGVADEEHQVVLDAIFEINFDETTKDISVNDVSFEVGTLNQDTRVSQDIYFFNDEEDGMADQMDALEEYYNH